MDKYKVIRRVVFSALIGSASPVTFGSGIPVVDGAQITAQANEYLETAMRWKESVTQFDQTYKKQLEELAAQTGIEADIGGFLKDAQKYYANVKDIQKLIDNPQQIFKQGFDALTPELKAIYEKQGFGEMCERISAGEYTSEDMQKNIIAQKKRCEGELIISALQEQQNKNNLENVNKRTEEIEKIAKRAAKAQTAKEAQDLGNALNVQVALLNADKLRMDIERSNRELQKDNAGKEREKAIRESMEKDYIINK